MSPVQFDRVEGGKWPSLAMAALVHVGLVLFLFYGVRWQNKLPDTVQVDLVSAPSVQPTEEAPAPPPPPPPPPQPKVKVPEPKAEPKPVPKAPEPAPQHKTPDIAVKAPEPKKPPPKPEPEAPKPVEKPAKVERKPEPPPEPTLAEPVRTRQDEDRMRELLARDSENVKRSQQMQEDMARVANARASADRNRAMQAYIDKIRAKVKGNLVLPPGVRGDPSGIFSVDQLPDGSVIQVQLRRTTGNALLDSAIERAIHKSSPLPKPDRPELFVRTLELTFYPLRD
ncbi:MAG: TonB C-terminal domain-containing protein [Zoogloea sp.]|nr:TonB C-terminal domain-containing protein [Zoogloea sp.]